jgi:hypothetical protein
MQSVRVLRIGDNPQRVASQTAIKIIPVIAWHFTRCELGQLALR